MSKLEWTTMISYAAVVRRPGRALVVGVVRVPGKGERWQPVAVETSEKPKDVAAIFADHAHEVLGPECALSTAKRKCATYARKWARSRSASKPCGCDDISPRSEARPLRAAS